MMRQAASGYAGPSSTAPVSFFPTNQPPFFDCKNSCCSRSVLGAAQHEQLNDGPRLPSAAFGVRPVSLPSSRTGAVQRQSLLLLGIFLIAVRDMVAWTEMGDPSIEG